MNGSFEINETFKITDQGVILLGTFISEGIFNVVKSGDEISFSYGNGKITRTIKGLDLGIRFQNSTNNKKPLQSGILIQCENENEIENLKNWKPNKVIAEIHKKRQNGS